MTGLNRKSWGLMKALVRIVAICAISLVIVCVAGFLVLDTKDRNAMLDGFRSHWRNFKEEISEGKWKRISDAEYCSMMDLAISEYICNREDLSIFDSSGEYLPLFLLDENLPQEYSPYVNCIDIEVVSMEYLVKQSGEEYESSGSDKFYLNISKFEYFFDSVRFRIMLDPLPRAGQIALYGSGVLVECRREKGAWECDQKGKIIR